VTKSVAKSVGWITSGYPGPDRVPLLALLKQRLTDAPKGWSLDGPRDREENA
jgi:hypothetical protein